MPKSNTTETNKEDTHSTTDARAQTNGMAEPLVSLEEECEMSDIYFYSRDETYGWLSNFERAFQTINGKEYPTNEHFYQSAKAREFEVAEWIRQAPKPFLAMKVGRSLRPHEIHPDWENIKFAVMKNGLWAKFTQNKWLKEKLLATGEAALHENSPTDLIWGVKGKDMLGKLLMEVREELRGMT